jgi:peptidoglycan/LPS O-acetylase OafA/YrhL
MDSILLGILGAIAAFYKVKAWEWRKPLFLIGMVFLLVPSLVFYRYDYNWFTLYWRIPLESTGTLLLLPQLHAIKTGKGLMFRFLTFTSIISYSMYLLNYTPFKDWVLSRFTTWFGIPPTHVAQYDLIRLAAFLGWAYFGAWLLYRFVERPFLDLRSRIAFSR